MKAVIQRVKKASVSINGAVHSSIGEGLLVFLGVSRDDAEGDAFFLSEKISNLRIFSNEEGKFFFSLKETGGELLAVSQFTLLADSKKGRRPDFSNAAEPETAKNLYEIFIKKTKEAGIRTKTGVFAAEMEVELLNDGPVTIILDSAEK